MEEKELDILPASDDEFWKDSEVIKKEIKHTKCDHAFRYVGQNAECEKCRAGFVLGKGWNIKNKKIYFDEQLVF